jgi:O-antigen ligase
MGLLGAVALFLSASFGLFQASDITEIRTNLYQLALPFVVLWSFWNLPQLRGSIASIAVPAGIFLGALSVVVIYADIARPAALSGPLPQAARAAWVSGFNTQSTGWSHGVALYVPFLAVVAVTSVRRKATVAIAAATLIIVGQFIVFGRGGILIAIMGVLVVLAVRYRGRMNWLLVVAVLLLVPIAAMATGSPEPDPFARSEGLGFEQLDKFSSSRLDLLQRGSAMIADRPLTGYGFGNDWIKGRAFELQIHVTWLRMTIQGGVAFPIVLLAIVLTVIAQAVRVLRSATRTGDPLPILATILVLFGGMVASFIEPSAIIGAFHASALWWAAAGVTTRLAYDATMRRTHRQRRHWDPGADQRDTVVFEPYAKWPVVDH